MLDDLEIPPEFFELGGQVVGAILMVVSIILFVQGYRRLFILVGGVGALVGYVIGGLVAPFAASYLGFEPKWVITGCAVLSFLLAFQISKTMIRLMGSLIVFLCVMMLLRVFATIFAIDLERDYGDFGAGMIAIIAFFSRVDLRERLPMIMSAVLSGCCCIAGIHFIQGGIISGIDLTAPRSSSFLVVITILSMEIQNKDLERWQLGLLRKEVEKELYKEGTLIKKPFFERIFSTKKWVMETGMPPEDNLSLEELHAKHNPVKKAPAAHKDAIRDLKQSGPPRGSR